MKKSLLLLVLILAMALVFAACGASDETVQDATDETTGETTDETTETADAIHLSLGWNNAATGTPHAVYCNYFKEVVEERTDGQIIIDLYPASQLGSGRELYEGMIMGTVDMAFTGTSAMSYFTDQFYFFDVPLLFRSYDEIYKLMDDKEYMSGRLAEAESLGLKILGLTEIGLNSFVCSTPLEKPEDFNGLTIRCTENAIAMAWLSALGANPVAISSSEAFTSIQNGTVDGLYVPTMTLYADKYYTAADYVCFMDISSTAGLLVMSQITYDKLSEEQQQVIQEAAVEAIAQGREAMQPLIEEALANMEADGSTVIDVDMDGWYDKIEEVCWPACAETGLVTMDELTEIRELVTK